MLEVSTIWIGDNQECPAGVNLKKILLHLKILKLITIIFKLNFIIFNTSNFVSLGIFITFTWQCNAEVYIDDIGAFSNSWEEHMALLSKILTLLKDNGSLLTHSNVNGQ